MTKPAGSETPHVPVFPLRWDSYDGVVRDAENWIIGEQEMMEIINKLSAYRAAMERLRVFTIADAHDTTAPLEARNACKRLADLINAELTALSYDPDQARAAYASVAAEIDAELEANKK